MARGPKPGPRLSVEPLLNALLLNDIETEFLERKQAEAVRLAKFRGFFTLAVADEIACKVLRLHPHEVWGQEYEDKVWFDMHDDKESNVIAFPVPASVTAMAVAA